MLVRGVGIRFAITILGCLLTFGACGLRSAAAVGDEPPPTRPHGEPDVRSNEDVVGFFADRPVVPVTPPKNGIKKAKAARNLPAEWSRIVNRRCRLVRDPKSGWSLLSFEPDGDSPALSRWALPCGLLEEMEQLARDDSVVFRVNGETTVYKGLCFLLVRKATIEGSANEPIGTGPAAPDQSSPNGVPKESNAASPPPVRTSTTRPSGSGVSHAVPTPEQISEAMAADVPGKPVLIPTHSTDDAIVPATSVAPVRVGTTLLTGWGDMVADRVAIIVQEKTSKWWEVRFVSDNTLREPPLRILPCRLLERASGGGAGAAFRVSGEITQYKGRQYLLLRRLHRKRQMGQF